MKTRLLLAAFFLACGLARPATAALEVFACEPEWASLVTALGGPNVETYSASTALQDVHRIQPRPSLIAKYRQANLVVCTGAELELGWLPALAEKGNNPRVLPGTPGFLEASAFVDMLDRPVSVDRSQGDVHAYGNPHIQTGPQNILPVARALAQRLAEVDPAHAGDYRQRLDDFEQRWSTAMAKWALRAAPLKGMAVVSHHKSWVYLYDWLGLKEVATLEPKPGIPPSGAHLQDLLKLLKREPARLVVHSSYEDSQASQWLSERAGIPVVLLPSSVGGVPEATDLFSYYDAILDRLLKASSH